MPLCAVIGWLIVSAVPNLVHSQQITFAQPDSDQAISVSADSISRWQAGVYEVLHLQGSVLLQQEDWQAAAGEAILWVERPSHSENKHYKVIAYLEQDVVIDVPRRQNIDQRNGRLKDQIIDQQWLGRLYTRATVDLNRPAQIPENIAPPEIWSRAQQALAAGLTSVVRPVSYDAEQGQWLISPQTGAMQWIESKPNEINEVRDPPSNVQNWESSHGPASHAGQTQNPISRQNGFSAGPIVTNRQVVQSGLHVQILARDSSSGLNLKSFVNPQNSSERVSLGVGGFRIIINSPGIAELEAFRSDRDQQVNIQADNMVQWELTLADGSQSRQFYLEGNVVFSKDRRVIYANRMFYDVDLQQGTILDAEILTPVPEYQGLVRLKAEVVQQLDENTMQAFGTATTSSRLGVPRYWLQSERVTLTRQPAAVISASWDASLNPQTGALMVDDEYIIESEVNRVYMGGVPVLAWPRFKTNLSDPSIYLDRLGVNNDDIFGFQLTTGWDLYQLLGWQRPAQRTRWIGILDYLSERGIGYGNEFEYERDSLWGYSGQVEGKYRSWFIRDAGLDFLGQDRFGLVPEEKNRGRISATHQHQFGPGYQLKAELGYISDRNFLEQFYEREWDTGKDQTTGLWLERNFGTRSYNLTADFQVNDFFTQTSWLPRFDQFMIGQPVFGDRAVWHGHTQAGYAKLRVADPPVNASELAKFDPLAWEANVDGFRVGTRQEIDFPMQVGPMKIVPYAIGDLSYWQEDLSGNDLSRAYGQAGIRASLPFWKVDPSIQSVLLNVNGLAHKVNFDFDAFYADASQDLTEFALYDPLDDDAQEHFRRRFAFDTFGILPGGNVPLPYDERFFAFRSGMQGNVTAPVSEIADDLTAIKLGVRQRWQTKRGMPGSERVIDWITFDTQAILYPDADRDNFGADFGMFNYDFAWHVGDRFSLVSDGYLDFFSQGLRTVSAGVNMGRPEIGNAYIGYRMIEGPISSNILTANLVYRMSETWGVKAGGQIDFGATGSIGQTLGFVYIGESFLWQFGVNHDVSRDNFGFRFGFEPRFNNRPRLFRPGGVSIPPAGSRYLE